MKRKRTYEVWQNTGKGRRTIVLVELEAWAQGGDAEFDEFTGNAVTESGPKGGVLEFGAFAVLEDIIDEGVVGGVVLDAGHGSNG